MLSWGLASGRAAVVTRRRDRLADREPGHVRLHHAGEAVGAGCRVVALTGAHGVPADVGGALRPIGARVTDRVGEGGVGRGARRPGGRRVAAEIGCVQGGVLDPLTPAVDCAIDRIFAARGAA